MADLADMLTCCHFFNLWFLLLVTQSHCVFDQLELQLFWSKNNFWQAVIGVNALLKIVSQSLPATPKAREEKINQTYFFTFPKFPTKFNFYVTRSKVGRQMPILSGMSCVDHPSR